MTVLLRSRSLLRGVFHLQHHGQDKDDFGGGGGIHIWHSSTSDTKSTEWPIREESLTKATKDDNDNDDDTKVTTILSSVDDNTPLEHSRRETIALSNGFVYDETKGVQSILEKLTPREKQFVSDANMALRHYRAEKGNLPEAIRKMKLTLKWREEFDVESIKRCFDSSSSSSLQPEKTLETSSNHQQQEQQSLLLAQIIARENATGKIYCRGYDKCGRAILYLTPGRENSTNEVDNMRHLVYHLERAIACTQRKSGRDKVCIVIGYQGFALRNAPPPSTVRHTLTILQNHYPERMYRAYICDPPLVFRTFWSIIKHFVDPTTLEKIAFCYGKEGEYILERDFDTMTTERQAGGKAKLREFHSREYLFDTPFDYTFDEQR